jgi:hypothetical protein
MIDDEVPAQLIEILDARAGKEHSRSGPVVATLAEILTEYDRIKAYPPPACRGCGSMDFDPCAGDCPEPRPDCQP